MSIENLKNVILHNKTDSLMICFYPKNKNDEGIDKKTMIFVIIIDEDKLGD